MLLSSAGHAAAETPVETVGALSARLSEALEDGEITLQEGRDVLRYVDAQRIGRFALGRHVRGVDSARLNQYQRAFRGHLVDQMREHLDGYEKADLAIAGTVERSRKDVIVETVLTMQDGTRQNVDWRLQRSGGKWRVVDVRALELWLAVEQRAQFAAALDRNGGSVPRLTRTIR